MDVLISLLIILGVMISIVAFQSRKDKPASRVYLHRFSKLVMILVNIFKDIGLCASQKIKQVNWDLTAEKIITPAVDPAQMELQPNAPSGQMTQIVDRRTAPAEGDDCGDGQKGGRRNRKTRKASWY
jgi:hypothetical protein